jgi:hypothetical protein
MISRLFQFRVEGLFGLYDHEISLNLDERITIIIGPNGRGKTVCLKMIEALFRERYGYIADIPFRSATFSFTGGEIITLIRVDDADSRSLSFSLHRPNEDALVWAPAMVDARLAREIRRHIPRQWEQVGADLWTDETDGEELTFKELARRYPIPPKLAAALEQATPDEFRTLVSAVDCHLIETQRLLVLQAGGFEASDEFGEYHARRRARDARLAIQQKAQKLKTILKDTLTTYANLSQSLDSTYPLRVFEAQGSANLSQDQLREELSSLDERREALMSAGIMDTEYKPVKLRDGNIESGVAMALEIYVKDAIQKLNVFNNLRSRLDLFKELIDKRFIDKSLHIDRELPSGIRARWLEIVL